MALDAARDLEAIAAATTRDRVLIAAHRGGDENMASAPDKVAALLDAARALGAIDAPYALIGGVAVGIHAGVPRATMDVDLAVSSTVDRTRMARALTDAGFRARGTHRHSVNFRHPTGEPLQIVFDPAFDAMIERAEHFELGETSLAIVRKADLIAMKERAAADPARRRSKALRDQSDVLLLRGDVPDPDEGW